MPYGPCMVCGATNYSNSMGGPMICPSCDCGMPPHVGNPMLVWSHGAYPPTTQPVHIQGCICPPGSEATCRGISCPRRNHFNGDQ